jgi:hypothetical protein
VVSFLFIYFLILILATEIHSLFSVADQDRNGLLDKVFYLNYNNILTFKN